MLEIGICYLLTDLIVCYIFFFFRCVRIELYDIRRFALIVRAVDAFPTVFVLVQVFCYVGRYFPAVLVSTYRVYFT